MRNLLIACVLFGATPALACINDREVERNEQEFRSRYNQGGEPEQAQEEAETVQASLLPIAGAALGALLFGGALGWASRRT